MAATVAGRQDVAEVILDFALTSSAAPEEALASGVELISTSDGSLTGEMVRTSIEKPSFGINNKSLGPRRIFAPRLVDAQNRYGQTALHIAAKCKASTWFVDQLLHAGASVDVKDEYGYRPIDVARKLQHVTMEETLRKWQQIHGKSTGVSGTSERPGRKKKAKQKKAAAELDQVKVSIGAHVAPLSADEEERRDDGISAEDRIFVPAQSCSSAQESSMDD